MQYKFYDHMICKVWSKNTSNNNTKNFKTKIENSQQNWAQSHHEKKCKMFMSAVGILDVPVTFNLTSESFVLCFEKSFFFFFFSDY